MKSSADEIAEIIARECEVDDHVAQFTAVLILQYIAVKIWE